MIRILLVDDHKVVREGLKAYLAGEDDLQVVGEAEDGLAAARLAGELKPDVILMDLVMPRCDGIEGTRLCLQASPGSRVAVLTSMPEDERVLPALRAGAISYLLKDVSAAELGDAIRKTAAGQAALNPMAAAKIVAELHPAKKAVEPAAALSPREREVLQLIARGLGNKEIGDKLFIGERTVKTHVHNMLAKLGLADRTQLAIYALKSGLA